MKEKVVIGMSGGVDSSVSAYLLKEQGYEVIGVTMNTWEGCNASEDAKEVAHLLGIEHHTIDFMDTFKENVRDYFCEEYLKGHTPNPCVVCNRFVKFEALLNKGKEFGANYIATGHYAKILKLDNGRYTLSQASSKKDQTYALYRLSQEQLAHVIMPLGSYEKTKIREIAREIGMNIADKADSQEICFIPDNNYSAYIEEHTGIKSIEGNFIDKDGNILGKHKGIINYTIGQRKGLNLAMGHPVFVTKIIPETNEVVIGENEDIFSDVLFANNLNFMAVPDLTKETKLIAKIRYSHPGAECYIKKVNNDLIECRFVEKQRAITPGQSVVFYENDYIFGGGTIL